MSTMNMNICTIPVMDDNGWKLVASMDIPSDMILLDDKTLTRKLGTYVNDADFIYPPDFSYASLDNCFKVYQKIDDDILKGCMDIRDSSNNIITYDTDIYKTNRLIKKDTEITKRYGVMKWAVWLFLDIVNRNPLSTLRYDFTDDEKRKIAMNFKLVLYNYCIKVKLDAETGMIYSITDENSNASLATYTHKISNITIHS